MKDCPFGMTDILAARAIESPDKTAFMILDPGADAGRGISYEELHRRVRLLAARLCLRQWPSGRVLLIYTDVLEFLIAFLSCPYAGLIPVPVPDAGGEKQFQRVIQVLEDAEVGAVFCTKATQDRLRKRLSAYPTIAIFSTDLPEGGDVHAAGGLQADDGSSPSLTPCPSGEIAFIQYTSGSIENPKGVVITHAGLLANQAMLRSAFGCDADSVILSWLPFHHDMGLIGNILHTIYSGCTCLLMSPFHFMQSPKRWLENISRHGVTHSGGPNFAYDLCVDRVPPEETARLDLSTWKVAFNGSEPVSAETMHRFSKRFASCGFRHRSFFPCYGLAEATLLVSGQKTTADLLTLAVSEQQGPEGRIVPVMDKNDAADGLLVGAGAVAPGIDLRIIRQTDGKICGDLMEGEICIAGSSVTQGYLNRDNTSLFHLLEGKPYLKTGDLGFLYQGVLFVHGRLKEMLIIRGRNFYPSDIERVVAGVDGAIETHGVAVFAAGDKDEQFAVVAEIRRTSIRTIDHGYLLSSIAKEITAVFGISPLEIILTFPLGIPRTTSGKIQRLKCKTLYRVASFNRLASSGRLPDLREKNPDGRLREEVIRQTSYDTIRTYLIDLIDARRGFSTTKVDDDAGLTEIGVDSIGAMELFNRINRDLNIHIDAATGFRANTLSALITAIEGMLWLKQEHPAGNQITI